MTSLEMLREFKVGMDKIDSQSYPEIYDEQIFMYINKAINEFVNTGRKVFETDQTITDNLKSLIPSRPKKITPTSSTDTEYLFSLANQNYLFYIRSYIITKVGEITGRAFVDCVQHDDIEYILDDPYNKPKPYKVPITFARDSITAYSSTDFKILELHLVYVKQPTVVSATANCDMDVQLHYDIVDKAIELASISLGITTEKQ